MMMNEFRWVSSRETSEETFLKARKVIVTKARAQEAFWLLPEPDEQQYYFINSEESIQLIYRAPAQIHAEMIFSEDKKVNQEALYKIKIRELDFETQFWSTKHISHPKLKLIEKSTIGMFQSSARERHTFQKQNQTLHSVLGHNLDRNPSEYYPAPLEGFIYQLT